MVLDQRHRSDPLGGLRWFGSKAQNSTSSEYGLVAYQIKRNHTYSNMVGNILPADPPPPPTNTGGLSVKIHIFQNITMLHIKFNNITNAANILPADPPPHPPNPWGQYVKIQLVQNMVLLHIKLKKNHKCSNMVGNILLADSPPANTGGINVKIYVKRYNIYETYQM